MKPIKILMAGSGFHTAAAFVILASLEGKADHVELIVEEGLKEPIKSPEPPPIMVYNDFAIEPPNMVCHVPQNRGTMPPKCRAKHELRHR